MQVTARIIGLESSAEALEHALSEAMEEAVRRGAEIVAADARRHHTFRNRTGRLETHIYPGAVGGESSHVATAEVWGDTEYGSYLEDGTDTIDPEKWAFLAPAAERTWGERLAVLDECVERAVERAAPFGWVLRD